MLARTNQSLRLLASAVFVASTALAQSNFPPPPAGNGNPQTPEKELLGMALFFEEQLSSTNTTACATCHDFGAGGVDPRTATHRNPGFDGILGTADDQRGSPGVTKMYTNGQFVPTETHGYGAQVTPRRSPTVINAGYQPVFSYEGHSATLEQMIAHPILNPVEMAEVGRTWTDVAVKLTDAEPLKLASQLPPRLANFIANSTYPDLFNSAFGTTTINQTRIVQAIAAYLRTLNSDQAKWDLVRNNNATFTAQEQLGLTLFEATANGATSCNTCHGEFNQDVNTTGPIVGQMTMTQTGPYGSMFPERLLFHNIGIRPPHEDPGVTMTTGNPADLGKFRVASLRNVELAGPYFHNGSAETLEEVVEFYNRGGDFHTNQAANLTPRNYTITEVDAIVALLKTLTDPRLVNGTMPFDRPLLGSQNGNLVEHHGAGQQTPFGELTLTTPTAPIIGESNFQLLMHGSTPNSLSFLMWDTALSTGGPMPEMHLALSSNFQAFYVGTSELTWFTQSGTAEVPLPLPNQPALQGTTLFAQWLSLEPHGTQPWTTSNALRIEIQ